MPSQAAYQAPDISYGVDDGGRNGGDVASGTDGITDETLNDTKSQHVYRWNAPADLNLVPDVYHPSSFDAAEMPPPTAPATSYGPYATGWPATKMCCKTVPLEERMIKPSLIISLIIRSEASFWNYLRKNLYPAPPTALHPDNLSYPSSVWTSSAPPTVRSTPQSSVLPPSGPSGFGQERHRMERRGDNRSTAVSVFPNPRQKGQQPGWMQETTELFANRTVNIGDHEGIDLERAALEAISGKDEGTRTPRRAAGSVSFLEKICFAFAFRTRIVQLRVATCESTDTAQVRVCFRQRVRLEEREGELEESATIVDDEFPLAR
ncbi:hypothetical protein QFC20_004627 [Naganishia adeliensis]|uniref:Uncharacterized protein n=1 Tax=Naganishia adeliensis TaxID=92952 RepID=A0ACC2VYY5_9TREE|nr:hypothetical protein QFC20_004627 [Naganishia adeliensis]